MTFGFLIFALVSVFIAILSLLFFFLPAFIAFRRNHPNKVAILVINFFLGATFIGWIVCLVWALSGPTVIREETGYGH